MLCFQTFCPPFQAKNSMKTPLLAMQSQSDKTAKPSQVMKSVSQTIVVSICDTKFNHSPFNHKYNSFINNNVLSVQSRDLMLYHVFMCCMCYNQCACAKCNYNYNKMK